MAQLRSVIDALAPDGEDLALDAPDAWAQGRTLYGGLTAALCAECARRTVADLPPLRSAQLAFIGPASGRLRFRAEVLRRGRSAAFVGAECRGDGGLAARALFAYGGARESRVAHDLTAMPAVAPPEACEPFFLGASAPATFMANFEMRLAGGSRPLSGAARPGFQLWVRHLDADGVDPTVALLALADSPPPAAITAFPERGPISTLTWTLDLDGPVDDEPWRLIESWSERASDGYSLQAMTIWSVDGRRLAVGRQIVSIFV